MLSMNQVFEMLHSCSLMVVLLLLLRIISNYIFNRPSVPGAVLQTHLLMIKRPSVAGAVLQTPLSIQNSLSHPFPANLQDIINPNR